MNKPAWSFRSVTDECQSSAYEKAWDIKFTQVEDVASVEFFKHLFFSEDYVEELELSKFHQIVLGLLHRDLGEELRISRRPEIDYVDSKGRSALSWAALRGDSRAVSLLVEAGANFNTSDNEGNTSLIYSAQSKDTYCVDILLKAGADTKPKNIRDRNALTNAMWSCVSPLCIEPLLAAGIDVNTGDWNGTSPLTFAAMKNSCDSIVTLLRHGADIESADNDGDTALMDSLFFHCDNAMKLLLASGSDYTKTDSYGDPFLHDVAIYGGLRTIETVHEAKLRDLDIHATNKSGKTALEIARSREGTPDGFVEAFEIMLAGIEAQTVGEAPEPIELGDDEELGTDADSIDVFYDALGNAAVVIQKRGRIGTFVIVTRHTCQLSDTIWHIELLVRLE